VVGEEVVVEAVLHHSIREFDLSESPLYVPSP